MIYVTAIAASAKRLNVQPVKRRIPQPVSWVQPRRASLLETIRDMFKLH